MFGDLYPFFFFSPILFSYFRFSALKCYFLMEHSDSILIISIHLVTTYLFTYIFLVLRTGKSTFKANMCTAELSVQLSACLFPLIFTGILKLYETVLTNQECTATAAQFLTRLPEDLGADALFRAIASVRTSAHKRTFTQILQAHMDAAASHSV